MDKHQAMRIDNGHTIHADSDKEKTQYGFRFGYTLCGIQFCYNNEQTGTGEPVDCKRCIKSLIKINRV